MREISNKVDGVYNAIVLSQKFDAYAVVFSLSLSGLNLHTTATFPPAISILSALRFAAGAFSPTGAVCEIGAFLAGFYGIKSQLYSDNIILV